MSRSVPVARRTLLAERSRMAVGVVGIGAALALILLLQGLWAGFQTQISAYQDQVGADLFVAEPGTRNFLGDTSVVAGDLAARVRAVPGVRRADPIVTSWTVLDLEGRKQFAYLVGSPPGGLGGPWELVEGRAPRADDEVVVDRTLARQYGIGLGNSLGIMGEELRVVGLSSGTRSWMASFLFLTDGGARALLRAPEVASFVLVETEDPAGVDRRIVEATGLAVLTSRELARNDRQLMGGIMEGPLDLMVAIAFAAGTLVTALTVYSSIVERLREYGIAKALGAGGRRLLLVVLTQTAVLVGAGMAVSFPLFLGAARLITGIRPQFQVDLSPGTAAWVVGAASLMALLAAVVPTRRLARLEPASVYRG